MGSKRQFDTEPSPVTGQALHVKPMSDGSGRLSVGIGYPVSIGGKTVTRVLFVVLGEDERAALAAFLGAQS